MKLLYTDIRTSLTEILTKEAQGLVTQGKRVFYIAPNSLSFEKERAVLECLSQQASFAITVTRFAQMARYLVLNDIPERSSLDDITAKMSFLDLESLTDADKRSDLLLIFEKITAYLNQGQVSQGSPLSYLIDAIEENKVSSDFSKIALVIDGFTRFSAEEEHLVDLLHRKGVEIIIGLF